MSLHALRTRAARAGLHAPVAWLRNFGLDSSDVLVASHGRSGDTMLRFILGEILSGIPASFDNIQQIVPEIGVQSNAHPILPGNGRLIKTHEPYCREYRRAIYLIRDVRDAMLSFFARETAANCIHPDYSTLDDYIPAFFQGKVTHFGTWQGHVASWMNSSLAENGDLMIVRFEDLRKDPEAEITRCLHFLGVHVDAAVVQAAIRNNSLENMRVKEDESKKFPKAPGETGRQVGKGAIEGWRQKLTDKQLEIVDEYAGEILADFGYKTGFSTRTSKKRSRKLKRKQWNVAKLTLRSESISTGPISRVRSGGRFSKISSGDLQSRIDPSADRALRVRIGGRIANFFSWYRY